MTKSIIMSKNQYTLYVENCHQTHALVFTSSARAPSSSATRNKLKLEEMSPSDGWGEET